MRQDEDGRYSRWMAYASPEKVANHIFAQIITHLQLQDKPLAHYRSSLQPDPTLLIARIESHSALASQMLSCHHLMGASLAAVAAVVCASVAWRCLCAAFLASLSFSSLSIHSLITPR